MARNCKAMNEVGKSAHQTPLSPFAYHVLANFEKFREG